MIDLDLGAGLFSPGDTDPVDLQQAFFAAVSARESDLLLIDEHNAATPGFWDNGTR